MEQNPWLQIPADDYQAHMLATGQSAALREIFLKLYGAARPRRVLILGCTTGKDLELVELQVTETAVGVDLNREYLSVARSRLKRLGETVQLVNGDVISAELPPSSFDLIHAAFLLEYVDPALLFPRISDWLTAEGLCSVVTQNRAVGIAPVSRTGYDSLLVLEGRMSLWSADQVNAVAGRSGFVRVSTRDVPLPLEEFFGVDVQKGPRSLIRQGDRCKRQCSGF